MIAVPQDVMARSALAGWRLEVFEGREAVQNALTPERVQEWELLARESRTVSVYQSPGFVLAWYETHAPAYEPLLVMGLDSEGRVVGVVPLARRSAGGLVFAGAAHCTYAGWLAVESLEDEFPAACVVALHDAGCVPTTWAWPWLAPGSSVAWLDHPSMRRRRVAARIRHGFTPVVDLQAEPLTRFLDTDKRQYRRKMARLGREGEVRLVAVTETGVIDELFSRFTVLFDVRQLVRYGAAPFTDDPVKAEFYRMLIERAADSVLFYALFAGEVPVAFQFALRHRRRVMDFGTAFDQRWRDASPGKLLMDLVAERLRDEGSELIDRTPGGDLYKEEGASRHEAICALTFFPSARRAVVAQARDAARARAKAAATATGVSTEQVRRRARLAVARLYGRSPLALGAALVRRARGWTWSSKRTVVYRVDEEAWRRRERVRAEPPLHQDALEDFLHGDELLPDVSRQRLLARALERLDLGDHCYTAVVDGRLAHVSWLQLAPRPAGLSDLGARWPMPPGSAIMYDSWTAPFARGRGLHKRGADQRIADALAAGATAIFGEIEPGNVISRHNADAVGHREVGQVVTRTRLGRRRRAILRAEEPCSDAR
jgi:CelD/BcsL family acetyltransferase involved in cellulose biosynthesis